MQPIPNRRGAPHGTARAKRLLVAGRRSPAPVAEALARARVPFAVMTGFEAEDLMGELGIAPLLAKPFASADVERVVAQLLKGGAAV